MAEAAGTVSGKYETLRRLAVGGMGEVFLARERGRLGFSRLVVIKRMLPQLANNQAFVEMFVDEARIVGNLSHPNICQILELGDDNGVPFLVLEYVRGESLSAIWDRAYGSGFKISRAVTLRILADTARALHFAHEARDADGMPLNVIHRDISPHNVMITFHGDVKLMDFGIARADNRMHRTDTGRIKGKISYMSPEQLRGDVLDRRTDVFGVGVMLWELTLNQRLFGGGSEVETLQKAIACAVPRPRSIDPSYPTALETIVMQALAAVRDDRTATAGELAAQLVEQVAELGGAERADVGAVMQRLFPDECEVSDDDTVITKTPDHATAQFRPTMPLAAEPSPNTAQFRPTVAVTSQPEPGTSELRPTGPLPAEPASTGPRPTMAMGSSSTPEVRIGGPVVLEQSVTENVFATPKRRPWLAISAVVVMLGAAAVAIAVVKSRDAAPSRDVPAEEPRVAASPSLDATDPAPLAADAAPVVAIVPPPDAADPVPRPIEEVKRPPKKTSPKPPPDAAKAAPEEPIAAAAPPSIGTIAVSSDRVGVVIIDGVRRKSAPYQTQLPAGDHDVAVELGEGAGTLRARATIEPGKKTKCRVDGGALSCATSP